MASFNELRVFISSTFRDLQEEREHLVKKIFPEIRALCRERGVTFTEVDLRWGLTEEHQVLGQVIRTCLEEIDKCRPYFIGITGERYGYVPELVEFHKDPELLAKYPWIEEAALEESSIIDLEFRHAVLNGDPGAFDLSESRARFFFRRHRRGQEVPVDPADWSRLEDLKGRVRAAGLPVEEFRDPGTLGEMVYDALIEILDRDFADAVPPTPLDQERARHEAFAASRRRAYIPNAGYLKRLNEFADSPTREVASSDNALVIYAESGSGKSSLVAYWAEQYRRRHPDVHIVEHYVGIGAGATDHFAVMRHVMEEIRVRFHRDEEVPTTPQEIERAFETWLGYTSVPPLGTSDRPNGGVETLILIIDGINQLSGEALALGWVPMRLPGSVRLVITSTVEQTLVQLRERGWQQLGMQPLTDREREAIVVRFLSEYHKALSPEQTRRIAGDQKCAHPLFLRTLLEELRLFGQHERLDVEIDRLLQTTGTEDLFQNVLERLEDDFGARVVRQVMALLWASSNGLSEIELQELTGVSRMKLTALVNSLDYHLVHRDAVFTFFHDYLRRAVEVRYLADETRCCREHIALADYFQREVERSIAADAAAPGRATAVPFRVAHELVDQLERSGEFERLASALSMLPVLTTLFEGAHRYSVLRSWSQLIERGFDPVGRIEPVCKAFEQSESEPARICDVLTVVGEMFEPLGLLQASISMLRRVVERAEVHGLNRHEAYARAGLGWSQHLLGDEDGAMEQFVRSYALCLELGDQRKAASVLGRQGVIHDCRREPDAALNCYEEALRIGRELGAVDVVATMIGNIGLIYDQRGEHERAIDCFEEQIALSRSLGDPMGVVVATVNSARAHGDYGDLDAAVQRYRHGAELAERLGQPRILAIIQGNLGNLYWQSGELQRSVDCFISALSVHRDIGFRYGITYWLNGLASAMLVAVRDSDSDATEPPEYVVPLLEPEVGSNWRPWLLARARAYVEESLEMSREINKLDTVVLATNLLARIDMEEGKRDAAADRLRAMLDIDGDEYRAEIHYTLFDMGFIEPHRTEALQLYRELSKHVPKPEFLARIERLSANDAGSSDLESESSGEAMV